MMMPSPPTERRRSTTRHHWLRFSWDLIQLPASVPPPEHYQVTPVTAEDEKELRKVILSSFALDPSWNPALQEMSDLIESWLARSFSGTDLPPSGLVLRHGSRIIGASMLQLETEAEQQQLAPGPCIMMEYRNRSFGTLLLDHSLRRLAEAGLKSASALAPGSSIVARYLYPKFGGTSSPHDLAPLLAA